MLAKDFKLKALPPPFFFYLDGRKWLGSFIPHVVDFSNQRLDSLIGNLEAQNFGSCWEATYCARLENQMANIEMQGE